MEVEKAFAHEWQQTLCAWYEVNGRTLPWRETTDPYKIWLSEIILQQTRIAQGFDYYLRFVQRFPTVQLLAAASEEEVLRLWQGLGYYSRARNLHTAAQQIVALGKFPDTYLEIRKLKGVGDYTAAAIASFAFGEPQAVVDGNVYRVLARQFAIDTPIDTAEGRHRFAALAAALLDTEHPGRHNQALMDFGALQCTPKSPRCSDCSFAVQCLARTAGVERFPVKSHKAVVYTRHIIYIYARARNKVYLHRRGEGDIWQGLYEPIFLEFDHKPEYLEIRKALPWLQRAVVRLIAEDVSHVLTHRHLLVDVYTAELNEAVTIPGYFAVSESERSNYAVSRLVERIFEMVAQDNDKQ